MCPSTTCPSSICPTRSSLLVAAAALIAVTTAAACGPVTATGAGEIQLTASGEVLALGGYAFPPTTTGGAAFVDGWEVVFDDVLVTIDKITLSENPDKSATDQSQTDAIVATLDGPWAFDLHQGGPLTGKGGGSEQSVAFATLANQNQKGGAPFDPTRRYALGFSVVPASATATRVNMTTAAMTDYAAMVANGWTVYYRGTATWKGAACTSSNPKYDYTKLPTVVQFGFGFKAPTAYANCQNPDNDPAKGEGTEEHQRGIQIKPNAVTIAQITVHTDHPFWESFAHDTPAHFDQLAALAKQSGADWTVSLESTKGVNFSNFTDNSGAALPWRSCLPSYTPPNISPAMNFDTQGLAYDPKGDPTKAIRDYYDFMTYDQSTQGHLNSDGLCYVQRNYPSPQ